MIKKQPIKQATRMQTQANDQQEIVTQTKLASIQNTLQIKLSVMEHLGWFIDIRHEIASATISQTNEKVAIKKVFQDSCLQEIIKILGTPTIEQVKQMNPMHKEFKFPQIRNHSWSKVFQKFKPDPLFVDLISKIMLDQDPQKHCLILFSMKQDMKSLEFQKYNYDQGFGNLMKIFSRVKLWNRHHFQWQYMLNSICFWQFMVLKYWRFKIQQSIDSINGRFQN
ncbi:unnamed protein product [Paramecium sonneborni]|uniref:Uncharacterized protein n=1 Tax=Paramecium sonneborni TaxID=65129 RepID=A0A8S1RUS3_9CILI|nr:unnamed protein product [Paramecium sonneborni]